MIFFLNTNFLGIFKFFFFVKFVWFKTHSPFLKNKRKFSYKYIPLTRKSASCAYGLFPVLLPTRRPTPLIRHPTKMAKAAVTIIPIK